MAAIEICNYRASDAKKIGCLCNVVDIITKNTLHKSISRNQIPGGCFFYLTAEFGLLHNTMKRDIPD